MIEFEGGGLDRDRAVDPRERRGTPRVKVLGQIHGHIVTLDVPVLIREIGLGGFSIETALKFPVGAEHAFRLTHADGESVTLRGRVAHCTGRLKADRSPTFITGFMFLEDPTSTSAASLGALIDKITAVLSFDV